MAYVTWDIRRNRGEYSMYCFVPGTVKYAREKYLEAQNARIMLGRPHMFHVNISAKEPDLTGRAEVDSLTKDILSWKNYFGYSTVR